MPLPVELRKQQDRIDAYVRRVEPDADDYKKAVFAKWLIMLSAGYTETALKEIIGQYVESRANRKISLFSSNQIERYLSINMEKLCEILGSFSAVWASDLRVQATASQIEALNSVKNLRDLFAHGRDNGVRWSTATQYWSEIKGLTLVLDAVVR